MMCALFFTTGCSTFSYLLQAGQGQLALVHHSRSIDEVIHDPNADPALVQLLREVPEIKKFGESYGLKPTQNYDSYVELHRPYVVMVVTACKSLSFQPKIFKFPIVGSFNYLGWFSEKDAYAYAQKLHQEGWDVDVRGASAYSTLGWFKDPILSSMLQRDLKGYLPTTREALINTILHESVHATIYIKNQSTFNENVASFLGDALTQKYLEEHHEKSTLVERDQRVRKLQEKLQQAYLELKHIYESPLTDQDKLVQKRIKLEELQKLFPKLRKTESDQGYGINNATLIQYATYFSDQDVFQEALNRAQGDIQKLVSALKLLSADDFELPQQERVGPVLRKLRYE